MSHLNANLDLLSTHQRQATEARVGEGTGVRTVGIGPNQGGTSPPVKRPPVPSLVLRPAPVDVSPSNLRDQYQDTTFNPSPSNLRDQYQDTTFNPSPSNLRDQYQDTTFNPSPSNLWDQDLTFNPFDPSFRSSVENDFSASTAFGSTGSNRLDRRQDPVLLSRSLPSSSFSRLSSQEAVQVPPQCLLFFSPFFSPLFFFLC